MEKFDLCVIGGGPSGYAAAMRAVDFDKTVLLVERDRLGGRGYTTERCLQKRFGKFQKNMPHSVKRCGIMV